MLDIKVKRTSEILCLSENRKTPVSFNFWETLKVTEGGRIFKSI